MKTDEKLTIFTDNTKVLTYGDVVQYDLGLEPYELSSIFAHLDLKGSGWCEDDFTIDGGKSYDEYGYSNVFGILSIKTKEKHQQEFLELEKRWIEAEKKEVETSY